MGLVSGPLLIFVFVPSFLALWWPKIDRKSGFPQLFAKTVGSIHFIPGIYTYGVSLWTPIDFRVRALIFGPLVAKNWPKIGVSATFRENCRLDSFHPWDLNLWGKQGCQPVRNFRILYGIYMQNTGVRIWPTKYGNWALLVLSHKVLLPEQSLPVLGCKSVKICGILCLKTFKYLFNHQNIQSSLFHM